MIWIYFIVFGVLVSFDPSNSQVIIEVSPARVLDSTPVTRNLSITCRVYRNASLIVVFHLQLLRCTARDAAFQPIAQIKPTSVDSDPGFVPNAPYDLRQRALIVGNTSAKDVFNNWLTLSMNVTMVEPADHGTYQCKLTFQKLDSKVSTVSTSINLTVVFPGESTLSSRALSHCTDGTQLAIITLFLILTTRRFVC